MRNSSLTLNFRTCEVLVRLSKCHGSPCRVVESEAMLWPRGQRALGVHIDALAAHAAGGSPAPHG